MKMCASWRLWWFDGLVQERRNSIANAMELRLSCTNPSICTLFQDPSSLFGAGGGIGGLGGGDGPGALFGGFGENNTGKTGYINEKV